MLHANINPFLMHVGVGGGKRGLSVKIQMAFDHRIIIKKLVERIVIDQIYTMSNIKGREIECVVKSWVKLCIKQL